jgi:hypothetical protein
MILREVKLISLLVALCAFAAFGITASYKDLAGSAGQVVALFIVITLIVVAIFLAEALRQRINVPPSSPMASENVIGLSNPVAAGVVAALIATTSGGIPVPQPQIFVSNEKVQNISPVAVASAGSNVVRAT